MKQWQKIGIAAGALVLAIAAGTGAYAMRGGDDDGRDSVTQDAASDDKRPANEDVIGGEGGGLAAICLEGTVDCQDTDLGDPMDQPCPVDGCTAENYDCPPDQVCTETRLTDSEACPDGVASELCLAYKCVTLESDPPQTQCYAADCDAPAGDITDPAGSVSEEEALVLREQAAQAGVEIVPCISTEDCGSGAIDGARCLPPDCSVSSDGSVACPDETLVDPPADGQGQTEPGSRGSGGGTDGAPPVLVDPVE